MVFRGLNMWPWAGSRVVINNNIGGAPMPPGGCYYGGWMDTFFKYSLISNFVTNMTQNIKNAFAKPQQYPPMYQQGGAIPFCCTPQPQGFYPYLSLSGYGGQYNPYGQYSPYGQYNPNDGKGAGAVAAQNLKTYADIYSKKCEIKPIFTEDGLGIESYQIVGKDGVLTTVKGDLSELAAKLKELYPNLKAEEEKKDEPTEVARPSSQQSQQSEQSQQSQGAAEQSQQPAQSQGAADRTQSSADASSSSQAADAPARTHRSHSSSQTRRFSRGNPPSGYVWTTYRNLKASFENNNAIIRSFGNISLNNLKGKRVDDILRAVGADVNEDNIKLLINANPTAINKDRIIVKPEKLDLFIKKTIARAIGSGGQSSQRGGNGHSGGGSGGGVR